LQMIWDLETPDGVNYAALAAIHSRARRHRPAIPMPSSLSDGYLALYPASGLVGFARD
jgi:hypothetical protein